VHVSLRLQYSGRAAAEAERAAEWDKQHRVWLRLEVGGKGHVHVQLQASPFPKLKQWSEQEKECVLSMADRFGRGGSRSVLAMAALQQQVQHFGGEPHPFLGESSRAQAAAGS